MTLAKSRNAWRHDRADGIGRLWRYGKNKQSPACYAGLLSGSPAVAGTEMGRREKFEILSGFLQHYQFPPLQCVL